jgi:fumarate hydratase class II
MAGTRSERDTLGEVAIPEWAYWGAQTQRAVLNTPASGLTMPRDLIHALARIKRLAAEVHGDLRLLPRPLAEAIVKAASEVEAGDWNDHFPVDVFQTGSGTSTNMNLNEVIANRANLLLGARLGARAPVHPNDHVNLGQSSNDVIPTAIHLAARLRLVQLIDELEGLEGQIGVKAEAFAGVVKIGRTHLQDAVPMTLGQEFSAFAAQIALARGQITAAAAPLEELALGATAVGTGLNAHPEYAGRVIERLGAETGLPFRPAPNRFAALAGREALVALAGALATLAVALLKIANDLRLLASGPRAGFGEISLPALQPGSSIMPGKVNPVVPEIVIQIAAHVMGQVHAVGIGGQHGPLQLNVMMPMIAHNALQAIDLLGRASRLLAERCIAGLSADAERCAAFAAESLALATPLARRVGYDRAAAVAARAAGEKTTIREAAIAMGILEAAEADELLDPRSMLGPGEGREGEARG